jgi:hypothetical protein
MEYIQKTEEVATTQPLKTKGRPKPPWRLLPIRLSTRDVAIITEGVAWIAANHEHWRTKGRLPFARPDLRWLSRFDRGRYSEELMQRFLTAAHSVVKIRSIGGRLYNLGPFQIAGFILAVRVVVQRVSHGHLKAPTEELTKRAMRLINRLEKYRKRAKRNFIRHHGDDAYQTEEHKWQALVRWLRVHILDCRCMRKRRNSPMRSSRLIVKQLVDWTKEELIDRKEQVPNDRELHRFVRLALHYIRRGRTNFCIRDFLKDRVFASSRLATFITIRLEKRSQFKDNK